MKKPEMKEDTRKKMDNFWYYYKFHVLIGAFVLFMIIIFVRDMLEKVDYDYEVAFVTDYMMADEEISAFRQVLEKNAEDLNGDGEIHVAIMNYTLPDENQEGYDIQAFMAGQTRFTVDIQEGTSMIFFISPVNYEKYKDMEILPLDEADYVKISDCAGYTEAGSPETLKDMMGAMRRLDGTKLEENPEIMAYYDASRKLFDAFVSGGQGEE
ncbi:MAG: hypothetical protein ACI4EO_05840 [Blautia sp.]